MPSELHGLVAKTTLSAGEIASIKELATLCESFDHLSMRIDWLMLSKRSGAVTKDFLYYHENQLVGFLALDDGGSAGDELVGMVHPDFRRRGIFSALLTAARTVCREKLGFSHLYLICERRSRSIDRRSGV